MKKTAPCKKPCGEQEIESTELRIVWDHKISEKIYELEARILSSTILLIATLAVSVGNLLAIIFKK
jgi:O-succinylbenzoate synthase